MVDDGPDIKNSWSSPKGSMMLNC